MSLVESTSRVKVLVAERFSERLFLLDGQEGYFEQANPQEESSLQTRGVEAQWRCEDIKRRVLAWLRTRGIRAQEFRACCLEDIWLSC